MATATIGDSSRVAVGDATGSRCHAGKPRSRLIRLDGVDFLGRVRGKLGLADATAALADEHISGA